VKNQKETAAAAAAAAGQAAEKAISNHGLYSPEARAAVANAYPLAKHAEAMGCTRDDYTAHRN
jgi:hypothetical protein